ncbi:MAG: hypothetical protein JXR83_17990 [Deltaproteobacteria bacterium]|nr:hypothetical protein [Deltaproteobacteria bacterium]
MRCPLALAVALPLLGWHAEASAAGNNVAARIQQVERLLEREQMDQARQQTESLYRELPDVAPVQLLAGRLKFYQGDFQGALALLERALAAYGPAQEVEPELLRMARGAAELAVQSRAFESQHFVLRTPAGKDELLAPYALDALERSYRELGAIFDHRPARRVVVDVLPSPRALAQISPLTEQAIETSGTIALSKYGRLMITSPKALYLGYPWLDTLAHEYIHLLIAEASHNTVPVWLQEGLAKYYESRWRGEHSDPLEPGAEALLAKAVKRNKLITFAQMHPSLALLPSQRDAALAFAEVYTAVEFIQARFGDAAIPALLKRMRDGEREDVAMAGALGIPYERFVADWKRYLGERRYRLVPGAEPRQLVFKKKGERDDVEVALGSLKLDRATGNRVRLGGILRAAGRPKAAAIEYERAVQTAGAALPHLLNRLAATYLEAGEVESARATLEGALAPEPDNPQTQILLGRVALAQKRIDDARRAYELANRVHPFHPEIHAALLAVAREQRDEAAIERERRALRLLFQPEADELTGKSPLAAPGDAAAGSLTLETTPFVRVLVDDQDLGLWTPLIELPLKPGPHTLRLQNGALGIDEEIPIAVEAGKPLKISRQLRPGSGAK